ncbi:hypothetical protein NMG60_11025764 [Bertholletia excelsa]
MSIQFKFRSSASFDSVDIEGRASISVRELRSKIVSYKNIKICQDFDLVFSDALTGQEYKDENFQIPCGSSVIIKRVPAGSVPSTAEWIISADNFLMKDSNHVNPVEYNPLSAEMDDFGDFGADFFPIPETVLSDSKLDHDKKNSIFNEKPNDPVPRVRYQKLEESDLSEAIPRGANYNCTEPKVEPYAEHVKSEKLVGANCPSLQNADLPPELKCSLCNTFFKEAVMIPCCQHSFCEKCISVVLCEKARCPKCYSSKCKVKDLLPNLSLRQAIERFLESQVLMTGADNALDKYAPDGESGIQANDFSCAVTILQRDPRMAISPSATEKGSNHIVPESVYESRIRSNGYSGSSSHVANLGSGRALKLACLSHKKLVDGERVGYAHIPEYQRVENREAFPDFQGENQPHNSPQNQIHEEVDSTTHKNSRMWYTGGGGNNFMSTSRNRKGDRTCYMCGLPDHFIRDCPFATGQNPMLQNGNAMLQGPMSGYALPFWSSHPCAPIRPFGNMYSNSGMMPFNSGMVPPSSFAVPPYMPSMYGGFPVPGRIVGMGGIGPQFVTGSRHHLAHSEYLELEDHENRRKLPNNNRERGQPYDDDDDEYKKRGHLKEPGRSQVLKQHTDRETNRSNSRDSFNHKSQKHRHDQHSDHDNHVGDRYEKRFHTMIDESDQLYRRPYHRERLMSGVKDMPNRSDRYSQERERYHHRSSKKHERKDQHTSDTRKDKDVLRKKVESEVDGSNRKYHSNSESGLEPSSSVDQKKQYKDKDHSHITSHSRRSTKSIGEDVCHNRWQMAYSSDEDYVECCHYQKRRRFH